MERQFDLPRTFAGVQLQDVYHGCTGDHDHLQHKTQSTEVLYFPSSHLCILFSSGPI
jgi:hypothetical protein